MTTDITTRGTMQPRTLDEALRLAELLAGSTIVPRDYQGNAGNVLVAVQWGAELGLAPLQAMQSISVINGRPSLWGDAVLALVRGSGMLESIEETDDGTVATCTVRRRGEPTPVTRSFSVEDAKRAGLAGKAGPWQQYPARMRQMRARAYALRDGFADVLRGVHVAEEVQDIVEAAAPARRDTPSARLESLRASIVPAPPAEDEAPGPAVTDADVAESAQGADPAAPVLAAIAAAQTLEELRACKVAAGALMDTARARARLAYRQRMAELTPAAAPATTEAGDA